MQVTKGSLKNSKSGKQITFPINPSNYELSRSFDFQIESYLGGKDPLVAYRCAAPATFKVRLQLDRDVAKGEEALKDAQAFLEDASTVYEDTASTSPVEFKMGTITFAGFIRSFRWTAQRFDPKGEPTSAVLDLELIGGGGK